MNYLCTQRLNDHMPYYKYIQRTKRKSAFWLIGVFALNLVSGWVNGWHESSHQADNHLFSIHNHCSHDHAPHANKNLSALDSATQEEHDHCLLCDQNWLPIWPTPAFFTQSTFTQLEGTKVERHVSAYSGTCLNQLSDRGPPSVLILV